MKLQSKNIFKSLLVLLISATTSVHNVKAQGIFRCPLEETSGNHFSELFVINRVPYHINNLGYVLDYHCTPYKSDLGITATHFELVPAGRQYVSTPIARVVAAAAGQIIDKYNSYDDLTCNGSSPTGNYIQIQHTNGMTTKYSFLRKNSLTNKSIGDFVDEGEFLGYPGNQSALNGYNNAQYGGFAFEVKNSSNIFIDPFDMSDSICFYHQRISLWKNPSYMDDKVWKSRMLAVDLDNNFITDSCGSYPDRFKRHFNYGDLVDVIVKLANADDSLLLNIYNPVGVPITSTMGEDFQFYYLMDRTAFVKFDVPLTGVMIIPGTYTVDCIWYDSYTGYQTIKQTMRQYFTVGCVPDYTLTGTVNNHQGCIAGNNIYSSEVCNSGSRVNYIADNEIILNPGFKAYNGSDVFIYTDPCVATPRLENQVDIENENQSTELNIFPNPANDFITIKTNSDSQTILKIYNSTMQLMKTFNFENGIENQISTADLSPGIYFIDAQSAGQTHKAKFIVNH
ncbi:MAG: T9SS type A sorting domain-containing protein [Bacteroidia bacterium]|nr:T9SS type A sorting domain-containing protein [Bacteroidia bacterium]HQV00119.1 T9SS type A sorting domain-containing protein [Bacteroidia bacterium]